MCTKNTPSFQVDQWIQETRQLQVYQEDRLVPGDGIYSIYDTEIYKCSIIYSRLIQEIPSYQVGLLYLVVQVNQVIPTF